MLLVMVCRIHILSDPVPAALGSRTHARSLELQAHNPLCFLPTPQAEVVSALRSYSKSLSLSKRSAGGASSARGGGAGAAAAAVAAAPARKRRRRSPSPDDAYDDYGEVGQAGGAAWGAIAGGPSGMPGAPPYVTRPRRAAAAAGTAGAPELEGDGAQGLAGQQGSPFLSLSIEPLHMGALERPPPIRTSPPHAFAAAAAAGRPGLEAAAPLPAGRAASLAQLQLQQQRALSTAGSLGGAGPQTPLSPASSLGVKNLLALANQQPAGPLAAAPSGDLQPAGSMPPPPPVRMAARGAPGLAAAAAAGPGRGPGPEQQQQGAGIEAAVGMPALPQLGLAPLGGLGALESALPSRLLPGQLPALPGLLGEGFSFAPSGLQPTTLLGPWGLPPEAWLPQLPGTTSPKPAGQAALPPSSPLQQQQSASAGQQQAQERKEAQQQQQQAQHPAEGSQGQLASHPAAAAALEPAGATAAGTSAVPHGSAAPVGTDTVPAKPMPLLPSPLVSALPLLAPGALMPQAAWPAGWVPQQGAALSPVTPAAGGDSRVGVHAQLQQILGGILPPDMAARAAQELISLEAALQASHAAALAQPQPRQASHAAGLAQPQPQPQPASQPIAPAQPQQASQPAAPAQPQPSHEAARPGALAEPPLVPGGAE